MKLLHTSDWHLGAMAGERSLLDDQVFFVDQICSIAKEKEVDCILIAGDVFDRSIASGDAISLYDYAVTKLIKECGCKLIVIAGNHDSSERLASCSGLLAEAGLYITGSLKRDLAKVSFGDADIYMLPWITEEKVKSIFPELKEEIESLEDAYKVVTDAIRREYDISKKNIILSHSFITNSETSTSDRSAEIGFATQISASVFEGFDYVALGHIHKPQDVNEKIRYCGTPMPYSFGKEETQEKSVTLIDTKDMSREIIPLKLLHVRKSISGTLEELLNPNISDEEKKGYLRLSISDSYAGLETLSMLKRIYPNLLEVSGKTFDSEDSSIVLSADEFEKLETNPVEVFRHFCKEQMGNEPDSHLLSLFEKAVQEVAE